MRPAVPPDARARKRAGGKRSVRRHACAASHSRAGTTLLEVMVATTVIALLAAALGSAGESVLATRRESDRGWMATELGTALLDEIASLPFDDPQAGEGEWGPEAGEWNDDGVRALFDDVDDYRVWTLGQPLTTKSGRAIDAPGFAWEVSIAYVEDGDFASIAAEPTLHKRILVTIYESGELAGTFMTVRTQGGRDVDFDG